MSDVEAMLFWGLLGFIYIVYLIKKIEAHINNRLDDMNERMDNA